MAYDIYGNNLRRGFCEIHPYVEQEYPCSICYQETEDRKRKERNWHYANNEKLNSDLLASKASEMLQMLKDLRKWYEENQYRLGDYTPVIFSEALSLINEATELPSN